MTGRPREQPARTVLILAAMAAVAALVVWWPRAGDDTAAPENPPSETTTSTEARPVPSEEAFCAEFRRLAASQSEYAAAPDATATELLRDAADRLLAVGVPQTMTIAARTGYHTLLGGVYESLGISLDPAELGAAEPGELARTDAAFAAYLTEFCPA